MIKSALRSLGWELKRYRPYRETLMGLRSQGIRTVFDIGANTGQFAQDAARMFPEARIYSFEPIPAVHRTLAAWAQRSGGRARAFDVALGQDERDVTFRVHADHTPSSSLLEATDHSRKMFPFTAQQTEITVRQTTLDALVEREALPVDDNVLVKMDVQGCEDRVIAGGRRLLSRAHACLTEVTFDPLYQGQTDFRALYGLLAGLGFDYAGNFHQEHAPDGHVVFVDALFLRRRPDPAPSGAT